MMMARKWRFRSATISPHRLESRLTTITSTLLRKWDLLRLFDTDRNGRTDVTQTIASGWGHTADYHDWAIGLPNDDAGNYFASIACQQDDRSVAAAHLRGEIVKLTPQEPTVSNPHLFDVLEVSGGHRFAIGIARSKYGELFVSDNQGNYNPYNELNHVRQGSRFGFINQLEKNTFRRPAVDAASDQHPTSLDTQREWYLFFGGATETRRYPPATIRLWSVRRSSGRLRIRYSDDWSV